MDIEKVRKFIEDEFKDYEGISIEHVWCVRHAPDPFYGFKAVYGGTSQIFHTYEFSGKLKFDFVSYPRSIYEYLRKKETDRVTLVNAVDNSFVWFYKDELELA